MLSESATVRILDCEKVVTISKYPERSPPKAVFNRSRCCPGRSRGAMIDFAPLLTNRKLMRSIGVNVSGQIASAIAGGIILNIAAKRMGG